MVSGFLPFAVLPLYTNAERLDWSIVEAAQDLYASRWRLFVHAILPQTLPGLAAAVILTFIPAMGTFVVSDILGMRKFMLIGNKIEQSFMSARDIPAGAMISLVLMLLTIIVLMLLRRHWTQAEVAA
jgi:spermidine/putrescine transport system permease protein